MSQQIPTRMGFPTLPQSQTVVPYHPHYTWDLRYYGWANQTEEERFFIWALGPFCRESGCHEFLSILLNKTVVTYLDSSKQFHIMSELNAADLQLVENYFEQVWRVLPDYLKVHRSPEHCRDDLEGSVVKNQCDHAG